MMKLKFDEKKIFYPYVVQYLCSLHGYIELVSRQVNTQIKILREKSGREQFEKEIEALPYEKDLKDKFRISHFETTVLIGQLSLKSISKGDSVEIEIEKLSNDSLVNSKLLIPFQNQAASSLLIMGFELTRDTYDNGDQLWNFFYHCRNGAAHGGHFNITNKKRYPAKWDNLEITNELNGTPVFIGQKGGLLGPGDPLYFLHEIETKYIK